MFVKCVVFSSLWLGNSVIGQRVADCWCRADVDIPDPDEVDDEEAVIEQRRLARKEFEQVRLTVHINTRN